MDEFRYVILHLLTTKEIPCLGCFLHAAAAERFTTTK